MANVSFMRGDNTKMDGTPVTDGLIFLNTEEESIFFDNGSTRMTFSSAGHIIENQIGTDMAKRKNLQFLGAYIADDSAGDRTKVNVGRQMTKTAYNSLTQAEKAGFILTTDDSDATEFTAEMVGYNNTGTGMSATDVQGAITELNADITTATNTGITKSDSDINLLNTSRVDRWGKLVIISGAIRYSNIHSTWVNITDADMPTPIQGNTFAISAITNPENNTGSYADLNIELYNKKLRAKNGTANVIYFFYLVYLSND